MQTDFLNKIHSKKNESPDHFPLAYQLRPQNIIDFEGFDQLKNTYAFLKSNKIPSVIFYGPPGCGKTTLAHLLAKDKNFNFIPFNAVLGGVSELRSHIVQCLNIFKKHGILSIIFIDEIHRFNKAQQDALLPHVEKGDFTLIGATTQYPKTSINKALLSRVQIVELKKLNEYNIVNIVKKALAKINLTLEDELISFTARYCSGDARIALNFVQILFDKYRQDPTTDLSKLKHLLKNLSRDYDKDQNRHFDVISAYIKSMRGTDPNAAIYWLAVMLDGGEDAFFISRRLVIFAAEDVGNADPYALTLAVSAMNAILNIGMPEARIILAQATTYLANAVKNNRSYKAIDAALEYVRNHPCALVPDYLKSTPPPHAKGKYLYPHNYEGAKVKQQYTANEIPNFYLP